MLVRSVSGGVTINLTRPVYITKIFKLRPVVAQKGERVTVNATGRGFDFCSRK